MDQGDAIRTRESGEAQSMMDLYLCERRAKVEPMGRRVEVESRA